MEQKTSKPKNNRQIKARVERSKKLYVAGSYGKYAFSAIVDWEEESKLTINNGHVNFLRIWCENKDANQSKFIDIAEFNDGWDTVPKLKDQAVFNAILFYLEQLKPEDF